MSRVSLGVILPGNPEKVQKANFIIKILGFVCRYGWISGIVGILVCFALMFIKDWSYCYPMFRWLGVGILLLIPSQCIWDEKHRCEFCNHFFSLRRISDDNYIGSSEKSISRKTYDSRDGIAFDSNGNSTMFSSIVSDREYGTEETKNYTYNIRCRHCGAVCKVERSKTTQHY